MSSSPDEPVTSQPGQPIPMGPGEEVNKTDNNADERTNIKTTGTPSYGTDEALLPQPAPVTAPVSASEEDTSQSISRD